MNKQELIDKYEYELKLLRLQFGEIFKTKVYEELLDYLKQLDEPQKVVVPQFVADWIKYCKFTSVDLYHALEMGDLYFGNYANQKDDLKLKDFFEVEGNQELFARAWLDGYTVEKEKRYLVKIIGIKDYYSYLNYRKEEKSWTVESKMEVDTIRTSHTRKELEDAGFGWVFDCEGVEVEEVE